MGERFYINCPLGPGPLELTGPEAHHLATVRRLRAGDVIRLFNGDGHEYPARISRVERRQIQIDVLGQESGAPELSYHLEVAAPIPKGDRAQFLIEKLTELGVTTFVPLSTAYSVVQPREAKLEKLQRWVIEASKQCGRNVLMRIEPLTDWADYLGRHRPGSVRVLAHPEQPASGPPLDVLALPEDFRALQAAVGPEGGFRQDEVTAARKAGWRLVSLGPRILRMETAALTLAAWAIARNGF